MGGARIKSSFLFLYYAVLPGRIDLISLGVVRFPFDSLETLRLLAGNLPAIPSSFTEVPLHLDLEIDPGSESGNTSSRELYLALSVWPLDSSLAPPACALPSLSTVYPGQNASRPDIIINHHECDYMV